MDCFEFSFCHGGSLGSLVWFNAFRGFRQAQKPVGAYSEVKCQFTKVVKLWLPGSNFPVCVGLLGNADFPRDFRLCFGSSEQTQIRAE